jgi:GGDEF domain-containing protein
VPPSVAGLVGRVEWDRLVADESERQRRYGRPSAIVLVEVAGLDRATAQAGPGVVGRVISPCGATLVAAARASDRVTRLGDGRFGVLLREADADGASRYAKRAVAACDPWLAALPWQLRLSVGWASPDGGDDLLAAFRQAERRLEASKSG